MTDAALGSFEWHTFNVFNSLTRWGVPIFVMVSGALFLGKERPIPELLKKNVFKIVILFVFWSTAYALCGYLANHAPFHLKDFIVSVVSGHYHLWFLYMLIGLYLAVPLLRKVAENEKIMYYFLVLAALFSYLLPVCVNLISLKSASFAAILDSNLYQIGLSAACASFGCFVLGYLLHQKQFPKKIRCFVYLLGVCGALITIFGTVIASAYAKEFVKFFYYYLSINVLAMGVAIFVFAKAHWNKPLSSEKSKRVLQTLSRCTLGVYLIHPLFLALLKKVFETQLMGSAPLLSVPALSIAVFLLSLAVALLLNRIPFVRKWLI